eukprot:TRINITY_DN652_c0_g1_i1.p1 TRINITY_DN652_c0_g1~~TRINITY_DN652_c0_g1_i1.p1  ORF type:complete len:296 (-),score=40.68 TRINITY_DN652_c0_g1_i1:437-1324(-)
MALFRRSATLSLFHRSAPLCKEVYVTTTMKKDGDIVTERFTVDTKGIDWRYRELFSETYNYRPEYATYDYLGNMAAMFEPKKPQNTRLGKYIFQLLKKFEGWVSYEPDNIWHTVFPGSRLASNYEAAAKDHSARGDRQADSFKIRYWDRDETRIHLERKRRMRVIRRRHVNPMRRCWIEQRIPLLEELIVQTEGELMSANPHDREFIEKLRTLHRARRRLRLAKESMADESRIWWPFVLLPRTEDNPQIYCSWLGSSGHPLDRFWWHSRFDDRGDPTLVYQGPQTAAGAMPQKYA